MSINMALIFTLSMVEAAVTINRNGCLPVIVDALWRWGKLLEMPIRLLSRSENLENMKDITR